VATESNDGYTLYGNTWSALAYADDVALLAQTPEGMERTLVPVEMASMALRFNFAKYATLYVGAGNGGLEKEFYRRNSKFRGKRSIPWLRMSRTPILAFQRSSPLTRLPTPPLGTCRLGHARG